MNLNDKQLEAVETINGPLLILAGAGAGKTKTIVERVVNIIKNGIEPENILCVTFTNKAAKEMLSRIIERLREENLIENGINYFINKNIPTIKTFHSLGLQILKENGQSLGFNKNLSILDTNDTLQIIKEILNSLSIDTKLYEPSKIRNIISKEKSSSNTPDDYSKKIANYTMEIVEKAWRLYDKELKKRVAVDFDDLIIKTIELLRSNHSVKEFYRKKFKYIHIDEYQDTNNSQYELIKELINDEKNICVVGDIDQNIYSWRGANLQNMLNFEKDFPGGKVVLLEENYRSTQNILNLANNSIEKNKVRFPKNLFTNKETGEPIEICPAFDEKKEAENIINNIKILLKNENINLKDIAILFRTNFQSRILEEYFLRANIPYKLLGTKFFDRKEIKDIMSYLRFSKNRENITDLKRILEFPKRGFGKTSLLKIFSNDIKDISYSLQEKLKETQNLLDKIAKKIENNEDKLSEIIMFTIKESEIEEELMNGSDEDRERLENIRELVSIAKKFDNLNANIAFDTFIEEASLRSDQDDDENNIEGVKLMTIHSAKGLEFDYTFIVGLEQDLFPHINIGNKKRGAEEEEEERRLFYVAITRAKKKLFLSYAESRTIYGERKINIPSEFLDDVNTLDEKAILYNETFYGENNNFINKNNSKKSFSFFDEIDFEDF